MNIIVDEEALEKARKITGKKTYSETINFALSEIVRRDEFRQGMKDLKDTVWFEGRGLKELMRLRTDSGLPGRRVAAKTVRAPRKVKKRRVSRR